MIFARARWGRGVALLLVLGVMAACDSDPDLKPDQGKPGSDAGPPPDPAGSAPPHFAFQKGTDELSKALSDLHLAFVSTPTSSEQAAATARKRKQALARLAQDPEAAATRLIDEFSTLEKTRPADEEGLLALLHLLGDLESTKGLTFLHDYALRVPPPASKGGEEVDRDPRQVMLLLRGLATDELGRRAVRGNAAAKVHLLDLASQASADVKVIAIRNYYAASKLRWKAKRELEAKLKPADRHLRHQIY